MNSLRSSTQQIPAVNKYLRDLARSVHPDQRDYQRRCEVGKIAHKLSTLESPSPPKDTHSLTNKLKKLHPEQLVKDLDLIKAMMIQDMVMEDKIKHLSKYVLRDTFDFGERNYYNRIAESVKNRLVIRGIKVEDSPELIRQKKQSSLRKIQMLKIYENLRKSHKTFSNFSPKKQNIRSRFHHLSESFKNESHHGNVSFLKQGESRGKRGHNKTVKTPKIFNNFFI